VRSNYRDEIVAAAVDMVRQGWTLRKAQRELAERFPGEQTPDYSTICDWMNNIDLAEELEPQEKRITHLTGRLWEERLERIERGEEEASTYQLAGYYKISRESYFKRSELKRPPAGLLPAILAAIAERREEILIERGVIRGDAILLPATGPSGPEETTGEN